MAFCTHVLRPILEYHTRVWSPHHIGLLDKIGKVQHRFTKKICCLLFSQNLVPLNLALLEKCDDVLHAFSASSFKLKLEALNLDLYTCY